MKNPSLLFPVKLAFLGTASWSTQLLLLRLVILLGWTSRECTCLLPTELSSFRNPLFTSLLHLSLEQFFGLFSQLQGFGFFSSIIVFFSLLFSCLSPLILLKLLTKFHALIQSGQSRYRIRLFLSYFRHSLLHHHLHPRGFRRNFVLVEPKRDLPLIIFCE